MKWNQNIRRIVYQRLFDKFGPCSTWEKRGNPTGKLVDYKQFLIEMAFGLSKITGYKCTSGAVSQQICWGVNKGQSACQNSGHLTMFVLNRAIALEVGIIESKDMPNYSLFSEDELDREKDKND